ncbi:MAG: hypothetical protein M1355_03885 [Patescibacteria group bacterium]|nr:hypothetical protein [Patescibacteria group bacterium]
MAEFDPEPIEEVLEHDPGYQRSQLKELLINGGYLTDAEAEKIYNADRKGLERYLEQREKSLERTSGKMRQYTEEVIGTLAGLLDALPAETENED